jgi:hypothetical protein
MQFPPLCYAPAAAFDLFDFPCSLSSESLEEHLPAGTAEVLRLRAIITGLCDRSARRFAQDDSFVEGCEESDWCAKEQE